MKKFKTDYIGIAIEVERKDEETQIICVQFYNEDCEKLEENKVTLTSSICKQQFNDANLTHKLFYKGVNNDDTTN